MLKHPQLIEAYKKALNTVESCKTEEQLKIASVLVENFKEMYKQVSYFGRICINAINLF